MAALCLSLGTQVAPADTIYVDVDEENCPYAECSEECSLCDPDIGCLLNCPDGSQRSPYCTIQDGIDCADNQDTVLVLPGIYSGEDNWDLGWEGKNIKVIGRDGPFGTIIDPGESDHRGFDLSDPDITDKSWIMGFTIRDAEQGPGAAIRLVCASPEIRQCWFRNNTAVHKGGGLYISAADCDGRKFLLHDVRFTGNEAENETNGSGGAIFAEFADVTIIGCELGGLVSGMGNHAAKWGGGIYLLDSTATITSTTIRGNTAKDGGGIFFRSSPTEELSISDSKINYNTATGQSGGGIFFNPTAIQGDPSTLTVDRCEIIGNEAGDDVKGLGGGIHMLGPYGLRAGEPFTVATIENSIIAGNKAIAQTAGPNRFGKGGGLYLDSWQEKVVVCNCTFSDNEAAGGEDGEDKGGAIYAVLDTLVLRNDIFWGDTAEDGGEEILLRVGELVVSNCDVDGTGGVCDLSYPENLFVTLESNATENCTEDTNLDDDPEFVNPPWDYHIESFSPCVDAGGTACGLFDIDREDRVNWVVDMGADEFWR